MTDPHLDRLDALAEHVAKSADWSAIGVLSTGERAYVALAANRQDILDAYGDTIIEALSRIGAVWTAALVARWQYKGDPRKAGSDAG